MVGMLNKNANFEVSFRFKPISNAPVMAIPDLEAPGKMAKPESNQLLRQWSKLKILIEQRI